MVTTSDVLKCIADERCGDILTIIHESKTLSIANLKLTRKQYYSRLHNLITCGLVHKRRGRYQLTSFGKFVFDWHLRLKQVISDEYYKLVAIDIISSSGALDSERLKLTDSLIQNEDARRFLLPSARK